MDKTERMYRWFQAHRKGSKLLQKEPFASLPSGSSLLARKYRLNHLGGVVHDEKANGLLQEDRLSQSSLARAARRRIK